MYKSLSLLYGDEEQLRFTTAEEAHLHQQPIDEQRPGSILHDFQVLLDFLSPSGTGVSSANNFLPMKSLTELNQRLTSPITLQLKRPQQKSFPHIHGLYLLLRTTGLTVVKGKGKKQRLVLDETIFAHWQQLCLVEQYFTLLETWLVWSNDATLGEYSSPFGIFQQCVPFWVSIPEEGLTFANRSEQEAVTYTVKTHHVALFELFGFIDIQPGPVEKGWRITSLKRSPFGTAMMKVLTQAFIEQEKPFQSETEFDVTYGALQPAFQPYFPQWQHNLVIPGGEFEAGIYVFKVSILKVWRRIAIPNTLTLDDLSDTILGAFNFDDDHLYQFSFKDRFGVLQTVIAPDIDRPPHTNEVMIGDLPLEPGASMTYLYDFGDSWEFEVLLEKIEPPNFEITEPKILATHGKAPQQYWDENSWEGDWDAGDWNG